MSRADCSFYFHTFLVNPVDRSFAHVSLVSYVDSQARLVPVSVKTLRS